MIAVIVILGLLVLVLGYFVFNLYRKANTFKDTAVKYQDMFYEIFSIIEFSNRKIKELDKRGSFSGDDEVGFFFKEVQKIQDMLNDFLNDVLKK